MITNILLAAFGFFILLMAIFSLFIAIVQIGAWNEETRDRKHWPPSGAG